MCDNKVSMEYSFDSLLGMKKINSGVLLEFNYTLHHNKIEMCKKSENIFILTVSLDL